MATSIIKNTNVISTSIRSEEHTIPANGRYTFTCVLSNAQKAVYKVLGCVGYTVSASNMDVIEIAVYDDRITFYVINNSSSALSDASINGVLLLAQK